QGPDHRRHDHPGGGAQGQSLVGSACRPRLRNRLELPALSGTFMSGENPTTTQRPEMAAASGAQSDWAIELEKINKRFGAVHANKDIDLKVARGTIHGIEG